MEECGFRVEIIVFHETKIENVKLNSNIFFTGVFLIILGHNSYAFTDFFCHRIKKDTQDIFYDTEKKSAITWYIR